MASRAGTDPGGRRRRAGPGPYCEDYTFGYDVETLRRASND